MLRFALGDKFKTEVTIEVIDMDYQDIDAPYKVGVEQLHDTNLWLSEDDLLSFMDRESQLQLLMESRDRLDEKIEKLTREDIEPNY
jgi:hypothetical protein